MENSKKNLLWDSVLVLPFLLYTVVWLVLAFGFRVDFAPSGSYGDAMLFNLLLPLGIIGVGQILYAVRLIRETLQGKDSTPRQESAVRNFDMANCGKSVFCSLPLQGCGTQQKNSYNRSIEKFSAAA